MKITYFDEVKANVKNGQKYYFVGGVSISDEIMPDIELDLNDLAEEIFENREINSKTEFHAAHIYGGKGVFKGVPAIDRVEVLGKIADIISKYDGPMKRVYAAIDTTKIYNEKQAPELAFAFFCERVQMSLDGARTIMIGDRDDQYAQEMIKNFAKYREKGTPFPYGIEVNGLMDSVHFARSHHSRFLQLADVYLFLETHNYGSRKGWMAEALSKRVKGLTLHANRYKEWPK